MDTKVTQPKHSTDSERPPSYEPALTAPSPLHAEDNDPSFQSLSLPRNNATPADVRTYIRSFLRYNAAKYDVVPEEVTSVASKWRYGSGQELRTYDRAMWATLFGAELGLLLWKHVQGEIVKESLLVVKPNSMLLVAGLITSALLVGWMFLLSAVVGNNIVAIVVIGGFLVLPATISFFIFAHSLYVVMKAKRNAAKMRSREYMRVADKDSATPLGQVGMA